MKSWKSLLAALALLIAVQAPSTAIAQQFNTIPDYTVIGRIGTGSGSGPSQPVPWTAVLDKLFGTTQGSVVYRGASGWVSLGPGSAGQLLSSGGAGANPSWITASGTGTVTSVTCGTGLSGGTITISGTCAVNQTVLTNSLGADVAMTSANTNFTGPSVAQGTSGGWLATGQVTIVDTAANLATCFLTDGTSNFASTVVREVAGTPAGVLVTLTGFISGPAGNIRINCQTNGTTAIMKYNLSGRTKDSALTVVRVQ